MKELQKLIEYGKNYNEYKPIHDELKKLKNGWTSKRDKYEETHRAELTLWNAASRYLDVYKRQAESNPKVFGAEKQARAWETDHAAAYETGRKGNEY